MQIAWRAVHKASNAKTGSPRHYACDFCRQRKIRCIPTPWGCENCCHAGFQCIFSGRPHVAIPRGLTEIESGSSVQADPSKKSDLETEIHATTAFDGGLSPGKLNEDDLYTALRQFKFHIDYCAIDNPFSGPSSLFSAEIQDWILTQTGATLSFQNFTDHVKHLVGTRLQPRQSGISVENWHNQRPLVLPERELVESCLGIFTTSMIQWLFPVVHQNNFQSLVSGAYASTKTCHSLSTTMCICMFTAFISRHTQAIYAIPEMKSKEYVQKIFNLVPLLLLEDFSVEALQTLTMLALYAVTYGEIHMTELCLSWAARVLFALGGHRKPRYGETSKHSHARNLFWLCYILDKEISIRTVRPPIIKDEDCDLDPPANYVHHLSENLLSFDNPIRYPGLLFPSDIRLAMIKSKIYQLLYSREALELPDAEKLRRISILDEELNAWKSTCLAAASEIRPTADPGHIAVSIRTMLPRLEYYNCLARIHQFGRRGQDILSRRLLSCDEIAIEASRSTLMYTRLICPILRVETYWVFALSAIPAVLDIFALLLNDPFQPHFVKDMDLIRTMSVTFAASLSEGNLDQVLPLLITKAFIDGLIQIITFGTQKRQLD